MARIVSVWLPAWPIDRLRRVSPEQVPRHAPFALVEKGARGLCIHAANLPALEAGVRPGQTLADVRAMLPGLAVRPAEPARDRSSLQALARWLGRYGPARNADGVDGAWIDVTGVAHLFGGEAALLTDLVTRLAELGVVAQAGLADTLGAAHALARWQARPEQRWAIAEPGAMRTAIASLPVAALRLSADTVQVLGRLGLRQIGALYGVPRQGLERRFREVSRSAARRQAAAGAMAVLCRLDEALGLLAEPRKALVEPPETTARLAFAEPLISDAGIKAALEQLAVDLCDRLAAAGQGARRFRLGLYRSDGTLAEAMVGTSSGCRDPAHICRLMTEKLADLDAGLGIDVATLDALHVVPLAAAQSGLAAPSGCGIEREVLIDRLANRLGPSRIVCLVPVASHIPERATLARPALMAPGEECARGADVLDPASVAARRPPLLIVPPEPVGVVAEIPDGAPARLVWRRVPRRIVRAEGPERIAPEWWRGLALAEERRPGTRDYYRLEDEHGAGYWVFREGLYGEEGRDPRWFVHGVWA